MTYDDVHGSAGEQVGSYALVHAAHDRLRPAGIRTGTACPAQCAPGTLAR